MPSVPRDAFCALVMRERAHAGQQTIAVPLSRRVLSDQITPVLAYRRLVAPDERTAPSFLLESIEDQSRQGRYSILGSRPIVEVLARQHVVTILDHRSENDPDNPKMSGNRTERRADPFQLLRDISDRIRLVHPRGDETTAPLPGCVLGGWFGYASYETVRYAEPEKLSPANAPEDDRRLPDLHFGFYDGVTVFDHAEGVVHLVQIALVTPDDDPAEAHAAAERALDRRHAEIQRHSKPLPLGRIPASVKPTPPVSNTTRAEYEAMIQRALEYIRAGDIFQVVLGQRFERPSPADPFDVYRSLRAVNPSPYMVYMQCRGCILVASSPEILCRVDRDESDSTRVTNRPLAGTRPRGATDADDLALEEELLADPKERAEHVMLVDLGRNDVGKVATPGSIELSNVMSIERYSHVMHISSTVTGKLREGHDAWDALRAALPVGTISGAPKIRAMQIIDELEKVRRGPYGGGIGWASLDGHMDIALALRTIVVPTEGRDPSDLTTPWTYHLQAAGGIVVDSNPDAEYQETVNKAAALARAIDLAEAAFDPSAENSASAVHLTPADDGSD